MRDVVVAVALAVGAVFTWVVADKTRQLQAEKTAAEERAARYARALAACGNGQRFTLDGELVLYCKRAPQ